MILLLISISTLFYRQFTIQEANASMRQLDYISGQLEYYMESAENYSKNIIVNVDVQSYFSKYGNTGKKRLNATQQLTLKNQIGRIIQSTSFIHSVTIYNTNMDMLVSTEPYPRATELDTDTLTSNGLWLSTKKSSFRSRTLDMEGLSYIRPFFNYSNGAPLGYLEITIPETVISKIYNNKVTDTNHIYAIDSNGTVRSTDGSLDLGERYSKLSLMDKEDYYALSRSSIVFFSHMPVLDWYIVNEINLLHFIAPTISVFIITLCIAVLCTIACLYVSHRVSVSVTSPLDALIAHTRTIKKGMWTPIQTEVREDKIGELIHAFNSMILSQEQLKNDLIEAQRMKDKASLDLLQQQVNPHFLYNTLDNICSLAELEEKETLIDLVMNLSTFYHEGLSNGRFYITVGDELELTKAYLHIMQIRYYNKFTYTIDCPQTLYKSPCLKLLLQPIVENSIYHGIKELDYMGLLEITVTDTDTGICFIITDNGVGFPPDMEQDIFENREEHFGIFNIHQRIQLYYGASYGLTIKNRPNGGCITTIRIRKETKDNELSSYHSR